MSAALQCVVAQSPETHDAYHRMPALELVERIVSQADRQALRELHDCRTLFQLPNGPRLCLAPFLAELCRTAPAIRLARGEALVMDVAYDLTVDKFVNLPRDEPNDEADRGTGSDCRHYYRAFLRRFAALRSEHTPRNHIQEEALVSQELQRLVVRHFRLSCLEARRRSTRSRSRYAWRVNGGVTYVWMPMHVGRRDRRKWLESRVDQPDPGRAGEKERVQRIVDVELGGTDETRFEPPERIAASAVDHHDPLQDLIEREVEEHGLARVVAEEKSTALHRQRPALRALGAEGLRRLVVNVFSALDQGCYEEKAVAAEFGLSPATLSRFAGSRWRDASRRNPPDLWVNVAHTVARHPAFVEIAQEAGVWPAVQAIVDPNGPHQGEEIPHE